MTSKDHNTYIFTITDSFNTPPKEIQEMAERAAKESLLEHGYIEHNGEIVTRLLSKMKSGHLWIYRFKACIKS